MVRSISLVLCIACCISPTFSQMVKASRETVALRLVQKTVLQKKAGQIDQVVALPDGDWAIRDANFFNPGTQALEARRRSG